MAYRIVVVDDDEISLRSTKSMLEDERFHISCLRSGKELLKFMEKNRPDLILLDIMMPEMDGFETFKALREMEEGRETSFTPVIFLTGENDSASEQQGLEIGASDYITKPFTKEVIIKRIENTITNRKTIETLTEEALVDKLTGFFNKSKGTDMIAKLCGRKAGALMILDLDSFKLVNDLFGHDRGDDMLSAFAGIVKRNTRETDTISRIGGDEFLAFFEGMTDESVVSSLILRINNQFSEEAEVLLGKDHGIPLGVSAGVVMVPDYGRDFKSLFAFADNALYTVKKNGKHGYYIYSDISEAEEVNDAEQNMERIIRIIEERDERGGALMLSGDSFALIYRFLMRFYKRYGGTISLMLFTLDIMDDDRGIKSLEVSAKFAEVIRRTLRMSDIIMQNGTYSFFVLLTERDRAEAEGAADRIMKEWNDCGRDKATVKYAFRYLDYKGTL